MGLLPKKCPRVSCRVPIIIIIRLCFMGLTLDVDDFFLRRELYGARLWNAVELKRMVRMHLCVCVKFHEYTFGVVSGHDGTFSPRERSRLGSAFLWKREPVTIVIHVLYTYIHVRVRCNTYAVVAF